MIDFYYFPPNLAIPHLAPSLSPSLHPKEGEGAKSRVTEVTLVQTNVFCGRVWTAWGDEEEEKRIQALLGRS